jgi:hypothetical protein
MQRRDSNGGDLMVCGCGKVARGAIGLMKVVTGTGRADNQTIIDRQAICAECERGGEHKNSRGTPFKCLECGCYVPAKTRLASESCPIGKWSAVNGDALEQTAMSQ